MGIAFSVVIPLYNKELYVAKCIDSVLSQKKTDFELIIVDDGSTDRSLSIVSGYRDKRLNVVSQENQGPGRARNRGVLESSGDWIAFLDADDVWTADHLAELEALISEFNDVGIVSTKPITTRSDKAVPTWKRSSEQIRKRIDYFRYVGNGKGKINSSSVAVSRAVFEKVGYFKPFCPGEDAEFWVRACLAFPCAISYKPTAFYCRGTGGISQKCWKQCVERHNTIHSVRDVGPEVAYLVNEMEAGRLAKDRRESAAIFVNSRITRALKIKLYNGRLDGISMIGDFYMDPLSRTCRIWKYLSRQPSWLLHRLCVARSTVRSLYWFLLPKLE